MGAGSPLSLRVLREPLRVPGTVQTQASRFPGAMASTLVLCCFSFLIIRMYGAQSLSRVQLFAISWTVAPQAPLSLGFSRQEYWSGLSFPSPGDLPNPGIEPTSPASPELAGRFFITEPPGKPLLNKSQILEGKEEEEGSDSYC